MEANGFKRRIEIAHTNNEYIKLIFQYPDSTRAIVKRGYVKKAFDDSFDFDEIVDGFVTYSYRYLVEIKNAKEDQR